MKSLINNGIMKQLIPVLSEKEKQEMLAYYIVYEKYAADFSIKATEELKDHPVFGKVIRDIPKDVSDANNKVSSKLQKDAILNNNWQPYIEYQIDQGIIYAKMGLDFKSWYEIVVMVKNFIGPCLYKEYGNGPELFSSLNGMNRFMDIAMSIIGEAYLKEKQEIILKDQAEIKKLNEGLEEKVLERTAQLKSVNKEMEAFTYSVSHDLRAPLRAVNGYAQMLNEDYGTILDEEGKRIIATIRYNATKMGVLIDDLLAFSRLGRKEIQFKKIDMNELTEGVISEMNQSIVHKAEIKIGKLNSVKADYGLMHQVMFNLISNAIKYSSKKEKPVVEIFSEENDGELIFTVKDNGAGFDMKYANKLFGVFQRLHSQEEFEGTGVGLAIVQRIVNKHAGKVWAEAKINEGAVFRFSLINN